MTAKQRAEIYLEVAQLEWIGMLCIRLGAYGYGNALEVLDEFAMFKPTEEEKEGSFSWWYGDKEYMQACRQTCMLLCHEMCKD